MGKRTQKPVQFPIEYGNLNPFNTRDVSWQGTVQMPQDASAVLRDTLRRGAKDREAAGAFWASPPAGVTGMIGIVLRRELTNCKPHDVGDVITPALKLLGHAQGAGLHKFKVYIPEKLTHLEEPAYLGNVEEDPYTGTRDHHYIIDQYPDFFADKEVAGDISAPGCAVRLQFFDQNDASIGGFITEVISPGHVHYRPEAISSMPPDPPAAEEPDQSIDPGEEPVLWSEPPMESVPAPESLQSLGGGFDVSIIKVSMNTLQRDTFERLIASFYAAGATPLEVAGTLPVAWHESAMKPAFGDCACGRKKNGDPANWCKNWKSCDPPPPGPYRHPKSGRIHPKGRKPCRSVGVFQFHENSWRTKSRGTCRGRENPDNASLIMEDYRYPKYRRKLKNNPNMSIEDAAGHFYNLCIRPAVSNGGGGKCPAGDCNAIARGDLSPQALKSAWPGGKYCCVGGADKPGKRRIIFRSGKEYSSGQAYVRAVSRKHARTLFKRGYGARKGPWDTRFETTNVA